jgi:hypothetical protein
VLPGPGFWAQTIRETIGHIPFVPKGAQLLDLIMAFVTVAFLAAHLPFWSVLKNPKLEG